MWKHIGEIILIGDFFKSQYKMVSNDLIYTKIDFCEQAKHIQAMPKSSYLYAALQ